MRILLIDIQAACLKISFDKKSEFDAKAPRSASVGSTGTTSNNFELKVKTWTLIRRIGNFKITVNLSKLVWLVDEKLLIIKRAAKYPSLSVKKDYSLRLRKYNMISPRNSISDTRVRNTSSCNLLNEVY